MVCCFCHKDMGDYYGNFPTPIIREEDKRCCDECNENIVIPFRHYTNFNTIENLNTIKKYILKMKIKPKGLLVMDRNNPAHETNNYFVSAEIIKEFVQGNKVYIIDPNSDFKDFEDAFGKDFIDIYDWKPGTGMNYKIKDLVIKDLIKGKQVIVIDPNEEFKELSKVIDNIKILKKEGKDISCTYHHDDENKKINYI